MTMASRTQGLQLDDTLVGWELSPAANSRNLDETCTDDLFVDSAITDLGYEIGGCYSEIQNSTTSGYEVYLESGGEFADGKSLIFVSTEAWAVSSIDDFGGEGFWSVGTVETLTPDGAVGDVRVVCTATGQSAAEVSGPTDGALSGTWKCSAFANGVTNYIDADYEKIECGCTDRTSTTEYGGLGFFDYPETAITVGMVVVVAVLFMCLCCLCVWRRRKKQQDVLGEGGSTSAAVNAKHVTYALELNQCDDVPPSTAFQPTA